MNEQKRENKNKNYYYFWKLRFYVNRNENKRKFLIFKNRSFLVYGKTIFLKIIFFWLSNLIKLFLKNVKKLSIIKFSKICFNTALLYNFNSLKYQARMVMCYIYSSTPKSLPVFHIYPILILYIFLHLFHIKTTSKYTLKQPKYKAFYKHYKPPP